MKGKKYSKYDELDENKQPQTDEKSLLEELADTV
jgi:hypothetical protein